MENDKSKTQQVDERGGNRRGRQYMVLVWTAGYGYYEDTNGVESCRDKMKNKGRMDGCAEDKENSIE